MGLRNVKNREIGKVTSRDFDDDPPWHVKENEAG